MSTDDTITAANPDYIAPSSGLTRPPLVSDEVWAAYTELVDEGHLGLGHNPLLQQIYAVAPELERLKP